EGDDRTCPSRQIPETATARSSWRQSDGHAHRLSDIADDLRSEAPEVRRIGIDVHDHVVDVAFAPLPEAFDLEARRPCVTGDLLAAKVLWIERGDLDLIERSTDSVAFRAQPVAVDVDAGRARDHVPRVGVLRNERQRSLGPVATDEDVRTRQRERPWVAQRIRGA